jgi:hypothetical protein
MPTGGYFLLGALLFTIALLAILQFRTRRNGMQLGLVLLSVGVYFITVTHFLPRDVTLDAKGSGEDPRFWAAIIALLVCVILGMLAETMYSWLDRKPAQRRKSFDWPGTIKPLLVSPLILIPTVAAFQNANIDLTRLGFPWLMMLLAAFEKGFLWRHYLKKQQDDSLSGIKRRQEVV